MQCEKFESRLNQLLDERRPAEQDDQLLVHASGCPDCRQMLAAQQLLFDSLLPDSESPDSQSLDSSTAPGVESPEALAERVLHALASNPFPVVSADPVESRPMGRYLALVAAAVVLIVALPRAFQLISGDPAPANHPIVGPLADSPPDKKETLAPNQPEDRSTHNQLVLDEDHYRQLAKTWGESVASGVMQLSSADGGPMTEAISSRMDQFKSLRPLRNSMDAAFDALRKTLPHIAKSNDDQAS